MDERFYGKYRGTVVDNNDPKGLGRIQVKVPSVLDLVTSSWAMPSVPYAGPNVGFFFLPPVGANVWVEFEGGNYTLPIWTGCFWTATADLPLTHSGTDDAPVWADTGIIRTPGALIAFNASADTQNVPKGGDATLTKGLTIYVNKPILTDDEGYQKIFMGTDGLIQIDNNNKEVITIDKDNIKIDMQTTATVTLFPQKIDLKTGAADVLLDATTSGSEQVTVTQGNAKTVHSAQGIDATFGSGEIKMGQNSVATTFGGGSTTHGVASVAIAYGAGTVEVGPAKVDINKGALSVI